VGVHRNRNYDAFDNQQKQRGLKTVLTTIVSALPPVALSFATNGSFLAPMSSKMKVSPHPVRRSSFRRPVGPDTADIAADSAVADILKQFPVAPKTTLER